MTGKEWRSTTEFLVRLIDKALEYTPNMPKITDDMTVGEYQYKCELTRRCAAEATLELIKTDIDWFKGAYLNRETADDFDEV